MTEPITNGVIALVGNVSDGFTPYGPYADFDVAIEAMNGEECWIMELHADADSIIIGGNNA
jgi:hypothetical protein